MALKLRKVVAEGLFKVAAWLTAKAFGIDTDRDADDSPSNSGGEAHVYQGTSLTPEALQMRVEPKPTPAEPKVVEPLEGSVEERRKAVLGDWPRST